MMKGYSKVIILLLLAMLAAIPPLVTGYTDLRLAKAATSDADASYYYEFAGKFLFWRPDLIEKAGLTAADDPQRAVQLLQKARHAGVLSEEGQLLLGDAYHRLGKENQAVQEWEALFLSGRQIPQTAQRLAKVYHAHRQFDLEASTLTRWLSIEKDNPQAVLALGLVLAGSGSQDALPLLETARSQSEDNARQVESLVEALKLPADDEAYRLVRIGQALASLNEWLLAKKAIESALEINPLYAEGWGWLGVAREQATSSGAGDAFEQAIKLDGNSAALRAMYGTYLQRGGSYEQARSQLATATRLEPDNPAWWVALAGVTTRFDLAEALKNYIQAVNLAPQDASTWYALAAFTVEQNAYLEDYGLDAALRAYALDPQNPDYMDILGRAQMAVGQTDSAQVMFNKALEQDQTKEKAFVYHFHLGLLYLQTGQAQLAKNELEKTISLDSSGLYGAQAKKIIARYFP